MGRTTSSRASWSSGANVPRWENVSFGEVPLSMIEAPEKFWGERADEMIPWLQENYDGRIMPMLQIAQMKGDDSGRHILLGWEFEGTGYPPLLELVYGREYAREVLLQNRLRGKIIGDHSVDGGHRGA